MASLRDLLQSRRLIVMDGAMGTQLQRAGLQDGACGAVWNLLHPDIVRGIHASYVDAGAQVLLTNTFQSNASALGRYGFINQLEAINAAALKLAREAAGPGGF